MTIFWAKLTINLEIYSGFCKLNMVVVDQSKIKNVKNVTIQKIVTFCPKKFKRLHERSIITPIPIKNFFTLFPNLPKNSSFNPEDPTFSTVDHFSNANYIKFENYLSKFKNRLHRRLNAEFKINQFLGNSCHKYLNRHSVFLKANYYCSLSNFL